MSFKLEQIASVADEIYFKFIDSLHDNVAVEYVETDPDNVGGTRNTEQGKDLYWSIEDTLREAFGKEDE
tara:strand:- start:481 stop:687 length:207 start_codon:yes stop_codon:yes gene_type:complete